MATIKERESNADVVQALATRLNVPITIYKETDNWTRFKIFIRGNDREDAPAFQVLSFETFSLILNKMDSPQTVQTIIKMAKDKILDVQPFKAIKDHLDIGLENAIVKYITIRNTIKTIFEDEIALISKDNPAPWPRSDMGAPIDFNVSFNLIPKPKEPTLTTATSSSNIQPAKNMQAKPTSSQTQTFTPTSTTPANAPQRTYRSIQLPLRDERRDLPLLTTQTQNDEVRLLSSLNIVTTKIIKSYDGKIHVFQPFIKEPDQMKPGKILEVVPSQSNENIVWKRTKIVDSTLPVIPEDLINKTEKVTETIPPKFLMTRNGLVKIKPKANSAEDGMRTDESDTDSTNSSDDEDGYRGQELARSVRSPTPYEDSDNENDYPIEHESDLGISKFFARADQQVRDYGPENIYKEAISAYQINYPEWKQETIELIKMLPMHDAYTLFVDNPPRFPADRRIRGCVIRLIMQSAAFYRLYTKEDLREMDPTELAHIYIAQMATHHQQLQTIGQLDHLQLTREAVKNYKRFWPNAKLSTLERIQQLPLNRLKQIFFLNKFPGRAQTIDLIKTLMSSEDRDKDHINYIFKAPNYLQDLPTETLHRILFIKLTFEKDYFTHIMANDPFDPELHRVNRIGKTASHSPLKLNRPLQTIRPPLEPGDEIEEPEESIQISSPACVRQHLIDEERRRRYMQALDFDYDLEAGQDTDENLQRKQFKIFSKKWPNYNTTLNFFKPTGLPDLAPCVLNQLDSLPPPFAYLPKPLTKEQRMQLVAIAATIDLDPTPIEIHIQPSPNQPTDADADTDDDDEDDLTIVDEIILVDDQNKEDERQSVRKRAHSGLPDKEEQAEPKRPSDDCI